MIEVPVATFKKATTTPDGSWRVTFDLPEGGEAAVMVAALASLQGKVLKLTVDEVE
jgi:hypothetical protein